MAFSSDSARLLLLEKIEQRQDDLNRLTQELVAAGSPNPPLDTVAVAEVAKRWLLKINGVSAEDLKIYHLPPKLVNLVLCIKANRPGKRLIFNGHLDTYPIGANLGWTVPPLGGIMKDGRIYGRGVSDMKAGIAASIIATTVLAEHRDVWSGEIVITLAGDEESMGTFGTQYLLDNVEKARGDAVVCGDVGSPKVIRFGEKGLVWFEIMATGKAAHGAHVHKGKSAIDLLRSALDLVKKLENLPVQMPLEISQAIASASALSESMSGEGESETLRTVTVNIGPISGGVSPNLVASEAKAQGDIRLPVGMSTQQIIDHLNEWLDPIEGISWRALQRYEPSYTSPSHDIILCAMAASEEVMNEKPVANMRVGASDTRLYRAAGIPSVVLGCTPNNMGAADEYVVVDELLAVAKIHALIAYDFLNMAT